MRTTGKGILEFLLTAGGLKRLPRIGWVMVGVPKPESVADHSFRTALITMLLCDELSGRGETVDRERAIKMALLHDIGEALTSDIPTRASRFVDKNEGAAVRDVLEGSVLDEYVEVWMDYNAGKSTEGKVVKFADRLEMLVQAFEYERIGFRGLDEFWEAVEELRASELYPYFKDVVEELVKMHREVVGCSQSSGRS